MLCHRHCLKQTANCSQYRVGNDVIHDSAEKSRERRVPQSRRQVDKPVNQACTDRSAGALGKPREGTAPGELTRNGTNGCNLRMHGNFGGCQVDSWHRCGVFWWLHYQPDRSLRSPVIGWWAVGGLYLANTTMRKKFR